MPRIDFGYTLRQLRHDRGETLEHVSEATGLSVAMLSRVERGERLPSPESVQALADHFGLPVDYLMSETIARRMVNRYGEESTSRAAEHLSREPFDLELIAGPMDEEDAETSVGAGRDRTFSGREPRSYGPFRERNILAALSATPQLPVEAAAGAHAPAPAVGSHLHAEPLMAGIVGSRDDAGLDIDPATEQVLRAAGQASEAAAVLVQRELPSLSPRSRMELVDRVASLAGGAAAVLQTLASDPDRRVRDAAREALRRLSRR